MEKRRRIESQDPSSSSSPEASSSRSDLRKKYEWAKKEIRCLKEKLKSVEEVCGDSSLLEFIYDLPYIFREVQDKWGTQILWHQVNPKLRRMLRQLLDEFAKRWSENLQIPILDLDRVKTVEEIALSADVVSRLWILKEVEYKGESRPWETGYWNWINDTYGRVKIDLAQKCRKNDYVRNAFKYRETKGTPYQDILVDEADLVRNIRPHQRECPGVIDLVPVPCFPRPRFTFIFYLL